MLEVSRNEIIARLATVDNPWWDDIADMDEWLYSDLPYREYFAGFYDLCTQLDVRRAVILMGPRRVGKTVMLHQAIHRMVKDGWNPKHILFASIDTPIYTGMGLEQFVNIHLERQELNRNDLFVVCFDEIQYLKDWEVHLKSLVDTYPNARFIASGSAAAALRLKSRESGAGRFSDFMLPPLTFAEYLTFIDRKEELIEADEKSLLRYTVRDINALNIEFVNYVNFGGYPEAVTNKRIQSDPSRFIRSDIIDKALLKDLPSLYGINDVQELYRLFSVIAYNTGSEFTLDGLSKASGVKKSTLRKYLEYLRSAFLLLKVKRVDDSGRAFKRERGFKLYLTNPSMRAALFHPVKGEDAVMGHLAETAIFSQWFHSPHLPQLRYARWRGGEVDIIRIDPETLNPTLAMEVKWSDRYYDHPNDLGGLAVFMDKSSLAYGFLTTLTTQGVKRLQGRSLLAFPSSLYCFAVGKGAVQGKLTELSTEKS